MYTCGKERVGGRGLGIRFPRLLRVREDKGCEDATTDGFVFDLYRQQAAVANMDFDDDNDMY